jgi:hypothetical protein
MIEGTTKREQEKGCVLFCHSAWSYFLEVVSISRNRATGKKEASRATWGQKKKRNFEGKVYQEQRTFEPYTHLS